MQKIEIVITNDAGETSVVSITKRVSKSISETRSGDGIAALSLRDVQAVSLLCMTTAMEFLPVSMQNPDMVKVVEAYHAIGKGPPMATLASK